MVNVPRSLSMSTITGGGGGGGGVGGSGGWVWRGGALAKDTGGGGGGAMGGAGTVVIGRDGEVGDSGIGVTDTGTSAMDVLVMLMERVVVAV